jgi:hypothetical protein
LDYSFFANVALVFVVAKKEQIMEKVKLLILVFCATFLFGFVSQNKSFKSTANSDAFQRRWTYISETSTVIYWQLNDIAGSATSFVEYGKTRELGEQTVETKKPRWSHFHRLTGLESGTTYYYKMVTVEPLSGNRTESELLQLTPHRIKNAVHIPEDLEGNAPYLLDKDNTHYILTKDITADGTAFILKGSQTTLDLDGHTVTFGEDTSEQVFGVRIVSRDSCKVTNGKIVQGKRSYDYSAAIASLDRAFERPAATEICGISTDVHLKDALPMNFTHIEQLEVHHNDIYSRVTELECRHYPGNVLLRVYTYGGDVHLHDNLLTEGCHWGIVVKELSRTVRDVEVDHNDIQHHQQYVNGYALAPCSGAIVHDNKVTSTGRGVHLTGDGTQFYNNYIDTKGHQQLSDLPARTRPFHHRLIELHGIKFEGKNTRNCKIYNNFVRITQSQPVDFNGKGDPVDKMENGVYIRSTTTSVEKGKLVDNGQKWEKDRWRFYYVKYDPNKPPIKITGNDETTLYGDFAPVLAGEYTIYMKWSYVAPTPLNIACYDPNGMNEIYNNTFIGVTTYKNTRHGDYGDSGEWATALMLVFMNKGPAEKGKYSAYIHDNQFYSNDLFVSSYTDINMDIRMENNAFHLLKEPFTTTRVNRIRNVGADYEKQLLNGNNNFSE